MTHRREQGALDAAQYLRRMRAGRPWVFAALTALLGLAGYPFLRQGLAWLAAGRVVAGWVILLLPAAVALWTLREAGRVYALAEQDVRRGRVRWVPAAAAERDAVDRLPLSGSALEQRRDRAFLRRGLTRGGYQRPDRARRLRRLLLGMLVASALLQLRRCSG